jgi:pyruvate kinase
MRDGSVELIKGASYSLVSQDIMGDETHASVNYPELLRSLRRGNLLHLADGIIRMRVEEKIDNGVRCTVLDGGILSSGKGVNAPGVKIRLDYPTASDIKDLRFGIKKEVDFVGLSFLRTAADVKAVKKLLGQNETVSLIAKIEKQEAVGDFDSILREVDGVMVARGDLGIEVPIERMPIIQKEIIRKCNEAGKQVIVATQMLMSMVNYPVPSRAEVSDVSNAILDGTDAVMLSDETAVGKYPLEAVEVLGRIARSTEDVLQKYGPPPINEKSDTSEEAIGRAACRLAEYIRAKAIVAPTHTGSTARRVSMHRPKQPIIALCTEEEVARKLKLCWGVIPVLIPQQKNIDSLFAMAETTAMEIGLARKGDRIVVTSGTLGAKGSTDLVKVTTVGHSKQSATAEG